MLKRGKQTEILEDKTRDLREACKGMQDVYGGIIAAEGYLLVCTPVLSKMKIQARIHQPNKWGQWPEFEIMRTIIPDKFRNYSVRIAYSKAGLSAEDLRS